MCDAAQEDIRALAQVKATMLLERDRIGTEGWVHGGTGRGRGVADTSSLEKENKALKQENGRLAKAVADLNDQLAHVTGMVSRMMASNAAARTSSSCAPLDDDPQVLTTTTTAGAAGLHSSAAEATANATLAATRTPTATGFKEWDGSHPWTCQDNSSYAEFEGLRVVASVSNAHGAANVLCCRLHPTRVHLVASGGADKTLRVHDWRLHKTIDDEDAIKVEVSSAEAEAGDVGAGAGAGSARSGANAGSARSGATAGGSAAVLRCTAPVLLLAWQPAGATTAPAAPASSTEATQPNTASRGVGCGGGGEQGGRDEEEEVLLAVGCMDGSVVLAALATEYDDDDADDDAATTVSSSTGCGSGVALRKGLALRCVWGGSDGQQDKDSTPAPPHKKFVSCVKWSLDGRLLATASADRTVKLWRVTRTKPSAGEERRRSRERGGGGGSKGASANDSVGPGVGGLDDEAAPSENANAKENAKAAAAAEVEVECLKTWHHKEAVEALAFLGGAGGGGPLSLVMAPRGHHSLTYVNVETMSEVDVPLNHAAWDKHVSFTVLGLEPSPDGKFLLAATDSNKHVVYPAGGHQHVRFLVGHAADSFSKPRTSWMPAAVGEAKRASFVVCNSQAEGLRQVYVYCLASQRVVARLNAHTGQVRDVSFHASEPLMCSASYDHTVKIWGTC